MNKIYKCISGSPVDYAAEELKKYLRMMMPHCSEIDICYDPMAVKEERKGFRLGLMQDFGLDVSDAADPELDDILYIEADAEGGIIAGDNLRSVLLAVYEYLRQQGCRWLFPGVDGEFIPIREALTPVSYRYKPSCRYRGQCLEGSVCQENLLDAIEFTPKLGLNVFMMQFRIPTVFYRRHYNHWHNENNRVPEPVSVQAMEQWKRQCEAEIAKRGLQFHDIGHGWTADPFGIDSSLRPEDGDNDAKIPAEAREFVALSPGKDGLSRKLINNIPNHTQFCMSNDIARQKVVQYAADYAEKHTNVDYVHMWLGDAMNSHCECENCQKRTPSDWYMILLNELDEELTRRNLNTRIVFIMYTDTVWAPETEELKVPDRFTMLVAPISRSYTQSMPEKTKEVECQPYVRNKLESPKNLEEFFGYFNKWKQIWKGANVAFEYHFWRHQYYDLGSITLAAILAEDVKAYKKNDVDGLIHCNSQRCFFPTGLGFYTGARAMFDLSLTADEIAEDYFSCAFGEDWKEFYDYLKELGEAFDQKYLERENSADKERSPYYNPAHAENLARVKDLVAKGRELIEKHYNMPHRIQTVSVRLLELHARFCELLAEALIPKTMGNDAEADRLFEAMRDELGKQEIYFQNCYDHGLAMYSLKMIFDKKTKGSELIMY